MSNFPRTGACLRRILVGILALASSSCVATSRMGMVEVSDVGGKPCFTVPTELETQNGIPLYGLIVSELTLRDRGNILPVELWRFGATDVKSPPLIYPKQCVQYGQTPQQTTQKTLKSLELFHPYAVSIRAKGTNTSVIAYAAEFCLTADQTGKTQVLTISADRRQGDERYKVCAPSQQR